jgi:hypothetical protein
MPLSLADAGCDTGDDACAYKTKERKQKKAGLNGLLQRGTSEGGPPSRQPASRPAVLHDALVAKRLDMLATRFVIVSNFVWYSGFESMNE